MNIYIFFAIIDDLKANEHINTNTLALECKDVIRAYKSKYSHR